MHAPRCLWFSVALLGLPACAGTPGDASDESAATEEAASAPECSPGVRWKRTATLEVTGREITTHCFFECAGHHLNTWAYILPSPFREFSPYTKVATKFNVDGFANVYAQRSGLASGEYFGECEAAVITNSIDDRWETTFYTAAKRVR